MINFLALAFLATSAFGQDESIKIKLDCPQSNVEKNIKVKFKDNQVKFSSDVFRKKNLDIKCIEKFKADTLAAFNNPQFENAFITKLAADVAYDSRKPVLPNSISNEEQKWLSSLETPREVEAEVKLNTIVEEMKTDPSKCDKISDANLTQQTGIPQNIIGKHPGLFSKTLDKISAIGWEGCRSLPKRYITQLDQHAPEKNKDFQSYCFKNPERESCKKAKKNLAVIDENLRRLVAAERGDSGKAWLESMKECEVSPFKDYEELVNKLQEYKENMDCADLQNGQSRVAVDASDTPIYKIERDASGKFEVSLGLNFNGKEDGVGHKEMMDKVQECYAEVNELLTPPGQPGFKVKILSPDEAKAKEVPVHQVNIVNAKVKVGYEDAKNYHSDIDCGKITHEVLHLLGLPDEYPGGGKTCLPGFPESIMTGPIQIANCKQKAVECKCQGDDCKKVLGANDDALKKFYMQGETWFSLDNLDGISCVDNVSTTPWSKLENKENLKKYEIGSESTLSFEYTHHSYEAHSGTVKTNKRVCECKNPEKCGIKAKAAAFKKDLAQIEAGTKLGSCPNGANKIDYDKHHKSIPQDRMKVTDNSFTFYPKPTASSLLYPAQVSFVLGAGCSKKAKPYKDCMIWRGYSDGEDRFGEPKFIQDLNKNAACTKSGPNCVKVSCANIPPECFSKETYYKDQ